MTDGKDEDDALGRFSAIGKSSHNACLAAARAGSSPCASRTSCFRRPTVVSSKKEADELSAVESDRSVEVDAVERDEEELSLREAD